MGDLYLWRQVFILTSPIFYATSTGMLVSFPSVLNPGLLSTNTTDIEATMDQVSWIAASNGIAGIFGFFVLPPMLQIFGRKAVQVTNNLLLLIGWIIFAVAHNIAALLAARIIQGLAMGGFYINGIIISEYVDPKRRGYFITFKKASVAVGALMCHASSLIWDWRQIAIFAITFPTLSLILALFWPESPSYLAMKGRFKESEKSFVWLHGSSKLPELHHLHSSQQQMAKNQSTKKWYKFLSKKDFMKPFVIASLATLILELSGKYYFIVFVIQMMMELVKDKSLAIYISICADVLMVIALLFSCFIISKFKRRTILFSFGIVTVGLMLIICFVIVLMSPSVKWLPPLLIVLHNFVVNISIIPLCCALLGEIFPLEHRGWGSCLTGIVFAFTYALLLKVTPVLIEINGVGGVYAIYGISIALCLLVLYFILPETKDRTLQEIENEFKDIKCLEIPQEK